MRVENGNGFKHMAQYALSDGNWMGPWGGFNEEGFCIVNTLSYNFSGAELASMNSQIIDMALRQCKTTADFEQLVDGLSKPIDVKTNYGVIDAQQHAAFYEVGPNGYTKYDVDDPQIAPNGVLVRTNYSLTGDTDRKVGEERWKAAEQFAADAIITGVSTLNQKDVQQNEWWSIDGQKLKTSGSYRGVLIGRQGKFMR